MQKAIHARVGTKWESCTGKLNYTEQNFNMLDYLGEIFEKKPQLKILYFTGGTMCRLKYTSLPTQWSVPLLLTDASAAQQTWTSPRSRLRTPSFASTLSTAPSSRSGSAFCDPPGRLRRRLVAH